MYKMLCKRLRKARNALSMIADATALLQLTHSFGAEALSCCRAAPEGVG